MFVLSFLSSSLDFLELVLPFTHLPLSSLLFLRTRLSFSSPLHSYKAQLDAQDHQWRVDGWTIYDELGELKRLGLENDLRWRITTLNTQFQLCESYPQHLAVPTPITDEELNVVAAFRSRGRLPALTWLHPVTRAALTRCR
jgi:myotubularin-related protein 1/2